MKICLITNLYPPYVTGGAELYVQKIAERLALRNRVIVITTQPYNTFNSVKLSTSIENNVKVYRFFPFNVLHVSKRGKNLFLKILWYFFDLYNLHSYLMVKKILKREKPDIVHIHNVKGLSISIFDAVKDLHIPLIHTMHDLFFLCPRGTLIGRNEKICQSPRVTCMVYRKFIKNRTNHKFNLIVAPSSFYLSIHKQHGLFSDVPQSKLPLGIELQKENKPTVINLQDRISVLYIGDVSRRKGVRYLVQAVKRLSERKVQLHVAGRGDDLEYCQRIAKDCGNIVFYGFVEREKKKELLTQAHITAVPSLAYENSPVSIYESLSYGTPVIASKIGGIPELIKDGYNGFLFEPGDVKELSSCLVKLIENPSRLLEMKQHALKSAQQYKINDHVEKLLDLYKEILKCH